MMHGQKNIKLYFICFFACKYSETGPKFVSYFVGLNIC